MEESQAMKEAREAFTNDSAFMIAHERALETQRGEDALLNDQFAAQLAGAKGKDLSRQFAASGAGAAFGLWYEFHSVWTAVRTKFIDDHIRRMLLPAEDKDVPNGSKFQFINLGAGLDTRVFRLKSTAKLIKAYEVDMEEINIQKKTFFQELKMKPFCNHELVSVDLRTSGMLEKELLAAGYSKESKSIIVAEGLIMYLGDSQRQFVREISSVACSGSTFILNFSEHPKYGTFPTSDLVSELELGGWVDLQFNQFGDNTLNYGRFLNDEYKPSPAFAFVVCKKA